jgi:hypothetical protein
MFSRTKDQKGTTGALRRGCLDTHDNLRCRITQSLSPRDTPVKRDFVWCLTETNANVNATSGHQARLRSGDPQCLIDDESLSEPERDSMQHARADREAAAEDRRECAADRPFARDARHTSKRSNK